MKVLLDVNLLLAIAKAGHVGNCRAVLRKHCGAGGGRWAYRGGMKTHPLVARTDAESDAHRAAVYLGFVAPVAGVTMLFLWLLTLVLKRGAWFATYWHGLALASLLAGLLGGCALYDRWESRRADRP